MNIKRVINILTKYICLVLLITSMIWTRTDDVYALRSPNSTEEINDYIIENYKVILVNHSYDMGSNSTLVRTGEYELDLEYAESMTMTTSQERDPCCTRVNGAVLTPYYEWSVPGHISMTTDSTISLEGLDADSLKSRVEDVQATLKKVSNAKTQVVGFVEKAKKVVESVNSFFEKIKGVIGFFNGYNK